MSGILFDNRKVKAYEGLKALGEYTGKESTWIDSLWEELVLDEGLMKEFIYYLDNHKLLDEIKCEGYGLTDLYVWQMDRYNLIREIGKNTAMCNKETMVLNAFRSMADMKKDPERFVKRLTSGEGMDR